MTTLRILLVSAAGLLLLLAIVTTGAFFYINSERGKFWLAEQLGQQLSRDGLVWKVERIEGRLPGEIHLQQVSAADDQGTWLEIQELNMHWQPGALLSRELRVAELELLGPRLYRLPDLAQGAGGGPPPRIPVTIRIDRFAMEEFAIDEAAFGQAAVLEAGGTVSLDDRGDLVTSLKVSRTDTDHGHLSLDAKYGLQAETLALEARFQTAAGGLLDQITGLPGLDLGIKGDGPLVNWHGSIEATSGESSMLQAELQFASKENGSVLSLDATAVMMELLPDALAALATDKVTIRGDVQFQRGGAFAIPGMELASDAFAVALSGASESGEIDLEVGLTSKPPGIAWINNQVDEAELDAFRATAAFGGSLDQPEVA